jgi:hypothetical protein
MKTIFHFLLIILLLNLEEGLARFTMDSKLGFFDETHTIIIKPQFDRNVPHKPGPVGGELQ